MKQKQILIWGVLLELVLVAFYILWPQESRESDFSFSVISFLTGLLVAAILFVLNYFLINKLRKNPSGSMYDFVSGIVYPLAKSLDLKSCLIISIAAGVGEELFFRGLLQNEIGIFFSSLLFAVLHFGAASLTYPRVVILYFFVSLIFGFLYLYSGSLIAPIVAHAVYDFFALIFLKKQNFLEQN